MTSLGQYQFSLAGKIRQIVILAILLVIIAYLLGMKVLAVGIITGVPVSIFNLYLVMDAIKAKDDAKEVQIFFMKRFFYRTIISFAVLFLSLIGGVQFMLGVALSLTLQVFTHILDGISLILSGKG